MNRVFFGIGILVPALAAGQVPARVLSSPIATLSEEFSRIYSVRELADGRVLISDNLAPRLAVASLTTGIVRPVGRLGPGPGEYLGAGRLIPLPGDSTLFLAGGSRSGKWLILSGAQPVTSIVDDARILVAAYSAVGADERGNVLALRPDPLRTRRLSPTLIQQASLAVLANRASHGVDTVLHLIDTQQKQIGEASYWVPVYSVPEQAILFPDGWIASVRLRPYRVEWRRPNGTIIRGPALPWRTVKIDDREKQAYEQRRGSLNPAASAQRVQWADEVSPIRSNALLSLPDGSLAILRSVWSGATDTNYDIVDRTGRLVATLRMAPNERLVGFGSTAAYVAVTDDDDIQRLQKHRWP